MITEDYCSYEVAKLLKEKGFDAPCLQMWECGPDKRYLFRLQSSCYQNITEEDSCLAPTLQMAMKWLREVHGLFIWLGHTAGKGLPWYYEIHGISDGKVKHIGGIQCGSYEVACESALKYSLENLI